MVDLGTPGGAESSARAVNGAGLVVGSSRLAGSLQSHAFAWTATEDFVDPGTLGGSDSAAHSVNGSKQIVGSSRLSVPTVHATLWEVLVPEDVAIDFGAPYGIWILGDQGTWSHLHGPSPESMVRVAAVEISMVRARLR